MSASTAPGELELVRSFVNTIDLESGEDAIGAPDDLGRWLAARGLVSSQTGFGPADVARAHEIRQALRALALANHDGQPDGAAIAALNRVSGNSRLRVRFSPDGGADLEPDASGMERAIARLLAAVYTAMAEGTWGRLKACRRESCLWAYYDRSKNQSRNWCSMQTCGNRAKAEQFRKRHSHA